MVKIFGKQHYIDFDAITDQCRINQKPTTKRKTKTQDDLENSSSIEVNIFKYELIKMCLDRILSEFEEVDNALGAFAQNDTSISFNLAFNSLIKSEIIKEDE